MKQYTTLQGTDKTWQIRHKWN